MNVNELFNSLLNHEELTREQTKQVLLGITRGEFNDAEISALLTAIQMRGITVDELLEHATVLFAYAVDEITVGVRNIHVPCTAPVPVEEVHSLVKFFLRRSESRFEVATEAEKVKEPIPLAASVESENKPTILKLLLLIYHTALRVRNLQHLCKKSIIASLPTKRTVHFLCVTELVFRVLNIVNGELVVVHAVGFCDDGIDKRAEAERCFLIAKL